MSRLSVRQKRLLIVAVSACFSTSLILWLILVQQQNQRAEAAAEHSRQVLTTARTLLWQLVNSETGMRGYVISGNPVFLESYDEAVLHVPQTQQKLEQLCSDNSPLFKLASDLKPAVVDFLNYHSNNKRLLESGKFELVREATQQQQGKRRMDRLRAEIQAIIDGQEAIDSANKTAYLNTRSRMAWLLNGGLVLSVLLAVALYLLLGEITQRIELLARNNRMAAEGNELGSPLDGSDEIAELDAQFRKLWQDKDLQTRRSLEIYAAELERSNKDLEDFASVASHDLQEPLRKIIAFGSRLESHLADTLDERGHDYLERIRNAAERMSSLNESLLQLSRVRSRARSAQSVELGTVVSGVISDLEERIATAGAKVRVGALPVISADASQMRQLFQNLISNALKFKKADEAPIIDIRSRNLGNGNWEIVVQDNGLGFEQRFAVQIFRPFQRLHGRSEFEGNGIGLTIVEKIMARHGGTVVAQSQPGLGSKFLLTLPENSKDQGGNDEKPRTTAHAALAG
jgi:signal transduction histidine kinase